MRDIKFKLWNDAEKFYSKPYNIGGTSVAMCMYPNSILMQYTGLKDKNNKEIYEGDIVQSSITTKLETVKGELFWSMGLMSIHPDRLQMNIEVIGNIYENPELLEVIK